MNQTTAEKWVFIINPTAGNHYAKTIIPKIEEEISKHHLDASIVETQYHGHAQKLAEESIMSGIKYIIAVGGDGTLNEVATAMVGNKSSILGIIPAGTGNDFIQILGFPNRFAETDWDTFFRKETQMMDAGHCNETYFFNGMGLGFDAEVAAQNYVDTDTIKKGGKDKYIWHIVKTLLFYREKTMTSLSNGNNENTRCFINTISIGRRFAGGFFLTPKAIANDGLLDVCSIKKLNLMQRFRILLQVPKGKHIFDKNVNYFQTQKLELTFDQKVPFHVDGELHFSSKFTVNIIPEAIEIIYNPNGKHYFNTAR